MANRTSHKVLHTSRAESEPRNATVTNHVSKEKFSPSDDDKTSLYGERSEKLDEEQGRLPSASSFSSSTQSLVLDMPPVREELDSPTLVPCNSPALSPSHSLAKVPTMPAVIHNAHSESDLPSHAGTPPPESLSPETSSFNISLVSDTSEDDDDFHLPSSSSLDSALFPSAFEVPQRSSLTSSRRGCGLGISGLLRKDGRAPFDGLGLVSIRASAWRTGSPSPHDHLSDSEYHQQPDVEDPGCSGGYGAAATGGFDALGLGPADSDSTEALSATFLDEALRTFTDDPFHIRSSALGAIPECRSWYALHDLHHPASPVHSEASSEYDLAPYRHQGEEAQRAAGGGGGAAHAMARRKVAARTTFSSATISSALKRSASSGGSGGLRSAVRAVHVHVQPARPRSTTWPTSSPDCAGRSGGDGMGRGVLGHHSSAAFGRGMGSRRSRTWRV